MFLFFRVSFECGSVDLEECVSVCSCVILGICFFFLYLANFGECDGVGLLEQMVAWVMSVYFVDVVMLCGVLYGFAFFLFDLER